MSDTSLIKDMSRKVNDLMARIEALEQQMASFKKDDSNFKQIALVHFTGIQNHLGLTTKDVIEEYKKHVIATSQIPQDAGDQKEASGDGVQPERISGDENHVRDGNAGVSQDPGNGTDSGL